MYRPRIHTPDNQIHPPEWKTIVHVCKLTRWHYVSAVHKHYQISQIPILLPSIFANVGVSVDISRSPSGSNCYQCGWARYISIYNQISKWVSVIYNSRRLSANSYYRIKISFVFGGTLSTVMTSRLWLQSVIPHFACIFHNWSNYCNRE